MGRCARVLTAKPVPHSSPRALHRRMRRLCPQQPNPAVPALHELPPAPELVSDIVAKALGRVDFGLSTCGRPALQAQPVAWWSSWLQWSTSLLKPKVGVRPIAVGELLRRLTEKCLMHHVKDSAQEHFFPVLALFFLDDGVLAGDLATCLQWQPHWQRVSALGSTCASVGWWPLETFRMATLRPTFPTQLAGWQQQGPPALRAPGRLHR